MIAFPFFLKGIAVGFLIAAPIGPIAALIVRRSLMSGWLRGLISGFGAAAADALYGAIGGFGVTFVSDFLSIHEFGVRLVGGILFCFLGIRTFFAPPFQDGQEAGSRGLIRDFLTTFGLTLANPMTLFAYAFAFAEMGVASNRGNYRRGLSLVLGVFLGSAIWWSLLAVGAGWFKGKLDSVGMRWINRVTGIVVIGFAIYELVEVVKLAR